MPTASFYDDISPMFGGQKQAIPPPTLCPDCRLRQRLLFRNDLSLYHRKSDLSGKQIVSMYAPEKPYVRVRPGRVVGRRVG